MRTTAPRPRSPRPITDCPCGSGARYAVCCGPAHRGAQEPPTAEALMRSRYAAFALGEGAYLARTLARSHEDHGTPGLAEALGRARATQRFLGLRILHAEERGAEAEVLFVARLFERGRDLSFAELSSFEREDGGWRYARGLLVPQGGSPVALEALTPALVRAHAAP